MTTELHAHAECAPPEIWRTLERHQYTQTQDVTQLELREALRKRVRVIHGEVIHPTVVNTQP